MFQVLDGCKTWIPTLKEGKILRMSENWVLMRIFGPKGKEITGGSRKMHSEELCDLYSSKNIIRMIKSIRRAGHVTRMAEKCIQYFDRKT